MIEPTRDEIDFTRRFKRGGGGVTQGQIRLLATTWGAAGPICSRCAHCQAGPVLRFWCSDFKVLVLGNQRLPW